jgi:hypothetical protein
MSPNAAGAERVREAMEAAQEVKPDAPRPLMRELSPADPFPVDALGDVLRPAAWAIHDRVQAPLAICGQSVLAAATLAVQAHGDVELPTRQVRPLSNYYLTIAATGERKTAVDTEALWPVRRREADLLQDYTAERVSYDNDKTAWDKARSAIANKAKHDRERIKAELDALGSPPVPPLEPLITCPEPTYEGMCKLLAIGRPSIGIFTGEGGQFIGGHGMRDESKLLMAAGLSAAWDGEPIKRVRAGDGVLILPGRRVAMHLMAQPEVARIWLNDRLLLDQGLLSRTLPTAPDSTSGTRIWRQQAPASDAAIKQYSSRLLKILELRLPVPDEKKQNELAPRALPLSSAAKALWVAFYNHVEHLLGSGGELEPVRGLANKLPEHAARIAAVLTLTNDIHAGEVTDLDMEAGITLAQHYAAEALRLFGASRVTNEIREAEKLRSWLLSTWPDPKVSLPDIYQLGPNSIRDAASARRAVNLLVEHGWLVPVPGGAIIAGTFRRDAWFILRG